MTFGNYVQSVTRQKIVPSVIEGIVNGNVLGMRLLTNSKEWSGESLKRPLMYAVNTSGGSYSGFDTFSTAQVDTRVLMSFDPRQSYQSVVLSNLDLAVNATQERVLDLLKVEMETAQVSMMDRLGTAFYGDGTGNSNKDFLGLGAAVDDGTNVATYANLTRSSYTALQASATSSVGAITAARLATAFDSATHGHQSPTLIVTDKTTWSYLEGLFRSTIRINYGEAMYSYATKDRYTTTVDKNTLKGDVGFRALMYRGVPIVADEKCTSGYIYFLNENYLEWYGLKHPSHEAISMPDTSTMDSGAYNEAPKVKGFSWTGLKEPVNQDAEIGQILLYGNLVCWSPRHQAVLKGITS